MGGLMTSLSNRGRARRSGTVNAVREEARARAATYARSIARTGQSATSGRSSGT